MTRVPTNCRVPASHDDTSTWLWPTEAAKILDVTAKTVKNLAKSGLLHPLSDESGAWRFDPDEILLLKRERNVADGKWVHPLSLASKQRDVFTCFRKGLSPVDIVIKCNVDVDEVLRLHEIFTSGTPEQVREKKQAAEMRSAMEKQEAEASKQRAERLERMHAMMFTKPTGETNDGNRSSDGKQPRKRRSKRRATAA